ncbi:hypothetical protein Scep_015165 [Stephania cephalantha]|uniref:Uncharacterized protein n=1 Tax=Stephania cephalantha TaxID=152367 RepID=A0AAP0J2P3_9MAGN
MRNHNRFMLSPQASVDRQRAQPQEYRHGRDQRGHDRGQEDRGQGPRFGDGQTVDWRAVDATGVGEQRDT